MQVIYADFWADYAKTNVNYYNDMTNNAEINGIINFVSLHICKVCSSVRRRTVMERMVERVIGMWPA